MSKEEVERASKVHVIDYMYAKGEPIQKIGNNYYRHMLHDSLVFHTNGKWFWNSRNKGGFGAISLARELYGLTFQDAVRDVNIQSITQTIDHNVYEKREFVYPKHYEVETINNAINYLSNVRGIDKEIVLTLKKHDLIAEDKLKNIIFKWRDKDGKIVGAEKQGTIPYKNNKRGTFKQVMANSKEDGGFTLDIGTPNKIAFFESSIDLLSYFQLKKTTDIRLRSMSGLKDQSFINGIRELAKEMIERGSKEKLQIIIAVDNDSAGEDFRNKWKAALSEENLKFDIPNEKDWNDDLRKLQKREKLIKHQIFPGKSVELEIER